MPLLKYRWQINLSWLGLTGLLALIYLGRIAYLSFNLWTDLQRLTDLSVASGSGRFAEMGELIHAVRLTSGALRVEAWPLTQPLRLLKPLPGIGRDGAALGSLLDLAADTSFAADELWQAASPALRSDSPQPRLVTLTLSLQAHHTRLQAAQAALQSAQRVRQSLATELSAPLSAQVAALDGYLPVLDQALTLAIALPELLGSRSPHTYLLLAQNSDELRATGGFISSIGIVKVNQGQLDFKIENSYALDDFAQQPYPPPPAPLQTYMGADLWLVRDANWSPDFPTSARTVAGLYALGQSETVTGVIAFDQTALRYILQGFGPLTLSNGAVVEAANLDELLQATWQPESGDLSPEVRQYTDSPLRDLGEALLTRLTTDPTALNWVELAQNLRTALAEKHLLVFINQPAIDALTQAQGWGGAMLPGDQDYLYVVDSNVGFNKVNAIVQRSLHYAVNLSDPVQPTGELTITYSVPGVATGQCQHLDDAYGTLGYAHEIEKCYWNYLRVYAPAGSALSQAADLPTPAEWLWDGRFDPGWAHQAEGESGTREFNQFLVVPYGQTATVELTYSLPPTIIHYNLDTQTYCLRLVKQPGTDITPAQVTITFPAATHWVAATPTPTRLTDTVVAFEDLTLRTDTQLCVTFTRP